MALAYDATQVTRDVDAMFVPHRIVVEEARAVADELGLPPWWLNETSQRLAKATVSMTRYRKPGCGSAVPNPVRWRTSLHG